MVNTNSSANSRSVSLLPGEQIGPVTGGRMQVWQWLCSFQFWPDFLSDLQSVEQLDEGNPGRGSMLALRWHSGNEVWEISHWHPGQQLDLIRYSSSGRLGWRISIKNAENVDHCILESTMQLEFRGFRQAFAPIASWFESRRLKRRTQALFAGLQRLQADI